MNSRREFIPPLAKYSTKIPGYTFHDNRGKWNMRPIFHASSQYTIFLGKGEGVVECSILRLCTITDNDVHLKECVEDKYFRRVKIRLVEGANFDNLLSRVGICS